MTTLTLSFDIENWDKRTSTVCKMQLPINIQKLFSKYPSSHYSLYMINITTTIDNKTYTYNINKEITKSSLEYLNHVNKVLTNESLLSINNFVAKHTTLYPIIKPYKWDTDLDKVFENKTPTEILASSGNINLSDDYILIDPVTSCVSTYNEMQFDNYIKENLVTIIRDYLNLTWQLSEII